MQLSSWAIRRPIPTIVLFLLLTVMGIFSFLRLPVNANPNVSFPIVTVSVSRGRWKPPWRVWRACATSLPKFQTASP